MHWASVPKLNNGTRTRTTSKQTELNYLTRTLHLACFRACFFGKELTRMLMAMRFDGQQNFSSTKKNSNLKKKNIRFAA